MIATLLLLLAAVPAAADTSAVPAGSARTDTAGVARPDTARARVATTGIARSDSLARSPRVVRTLEEFVVRARLRDPLSSQTAHSISREDFTRLPVDRATDVVALQAGVVARAGELHVRGGRAGELRVVLEGVPLNEPERERALELPTLALAGAELLSGGLDARYGGGLAGVLEYRTLDPPERPAAALAWETSGTRGRFYDRVGARAGGPLPGHGLGAIASFEGTLEDQGLPSLASGGVHRVLGVPFAWRNENRLLGHLKIAPLSAPRRLALQVLASREVHRPYDPMWSLDGWTSPGPDTSLPSGPLYSPTPLPGFERYRAADHLVLTDEQRLTTILSAERLDRDRRLSAALGWARARAITSPGGRQDESYARDGPFAIYGYPGSPYSDPFLVYFGDDPFFQRRASDSWFAHAELERVTSRGSRAAVGLGASYDAVRLREIDGSVHGFGLDSLRDYRAYAPGGYAYGQLRWVFEGMVLNAGLRTEYFTPGPQAEDQSFPHSGRGLWSLSPRLGATYPISVRDVFSASYTRTQQNPPRDFLYDNRLEITNRQPIGNPALAPATVIAYQAAVRHLFDEAWSLQVAYFFNDLFGAVGSRDTRPQLDLGQARFENNEVGHSTGLELSAVRESGTFRGELTYTYLHALGTLSREEGVPYGPRTDPRPPSIGEHPLDWDRRHSLLLSMRTGWRDLVSGGWITRVGSPFPWTPAPRRAVDPDLSRENIARLGWEEETELSVSCRVPGVPGRPALGFEVRNLFDHRGDVLATISGYPNRTINSDYDDYGAYRTETGRGGGAYWDDPNGDGHPQWVPVHDPRLRQAPRALRLFMGMTW